MDSDPDDYPIVQTAITGQANVLCTRGQAFQHAVVQRVCAAHNIRVLDDVSLMRELRHAASQQRSLFGLSNNIGMRRADRLFQIVQHLRGRRLTTGTELSQWLEASERTVYRDISDLSRSGVPIAGEAGSGYRILRGFEVPPLMFTLDEVEAPVIGVRIIESWGGPVLGKASRSAIEKIAMALPSSRLTEIEGTRLFAPGFHLDPQTGATLELIRGAIFKQCKLVLTYCDADSRASERKVRPLALNFWGTAWTLTAWCESKSDFRNFRLDRCRRAAVTSEVFRAEGGKTLADLLKKME